MNTAAPDTDNNSVAPFLKWAGGKRQLLGEIKKLMPSKYGTYCEPFVGGGAVLFGVSPKNAIINDYNKELIATYNAIKENIDELISELSTYKNTKEFFLDIRKEDRDKKKFARMRRFKKASRMIYLNHTCFNGIYRVNGKNEFNVPFGNYKKPPIVNEKNLRAVSSYLNQSNVTIMSGNYSRVFKLLKPGDFVYLDPPYDPISKTASFTSYTKDGFDRNAQIRLRKWCDKLNKNGIYFLLSNSKTDFILDQYNDYNINIVKASRSISAKGDKRSKVEEVLIRNYE